MTRRAAVKGTRSISSGAAATVITGTPVQAALTATAGTTAGTGTGIAIGMTTAAITAITADGATTTDTAIAHTTAATGTTAGGIRSPIAAMVEGSSPWR